MSTGTNADPNVSKYSTINHGNMSLTSYEKHLQSAVSRYEQIRYKWLTMSWMDDLERTFDHGYNPLDCMACVQASGSRDPSKVKSQIHFDGFMKGQLNPFAGNTEGALNPRVFVDDKDLQKFCHIRSTQRQPGASSGSSTGGTSCFLFCQCLQYTFLTFHFHCSFQGART